VSVFSAPYVIVLGVAQDAGIPQMGCESAYCKRAREDSKLRRMVSSVALVDPEMKKRWIFDATPDLPAQFDLLKKVTGDSSNTLNGIFLTHAHIGHYTGLMHLGRESMNSRDVNVYAMPRMKEMLETNAPWLQLVSLRNIALQPLANKIRVELTKDLFVEPFLVPHRDEFSETVGFRIVSASKSLIYLPDIDKWEKWDTNLTELVRANDYLLIDGTFYMDGEISRPMSEVPHPFVTETMTMLASLPRSERLKVSFIHLNHSNPLVQGDRKAQSELRSKGFTTSYEGQRFDLK
jgi:pyrroloquinoline quinone biosynthesis protein B